MTRPAFIILLATLSLVAMVAGCGGAHRYDSRLVLADSLMQANPDSALALVQAVDADSLSTDADRAYHDLLLTQARYKCYITATSDSAINRALAYYRHHKGEREKLTRAYIYKGAVMQELGNPDSAMYYYKTSEATADPTDYFNLGYVNLRIGQLYQSQFVNDSAVVARMRKANHYFMEAQDTSYLIITTGTLGSYPTILGKDSVHFYLNQAINYAKEIHSPFGLQYQSKLAGSYFYEDDYRRAKDLAMDIYWNGREYCNEGQFYHYAARSYIRLNQIDSARWLISQIPAPRVAVDSMNLYLTMSELAHATRHYDDYVRYNKEAKIIDARIMDESRNNKLIEAEVKSDAKLHEIELKNKANYRTINIIVIILLVIAILSAVSITIIKERINNYRKSLGQAKLDLEKLINELEVNKRDFEPERKQLKGQIAEKDNKLAEVKKNHQLEREMEQDAVNKKVADIVRHRQSAVNELYESIRIKSDADKDRKRPLLLMSTLRELYEKNGILSAPLSQTFWDHLRVSVEGEYPGIMSFIEQQYPNLTEDDIKLFMLYCAHFPNKIIKICMNYTSDVTASKNKKKLLAGKFGMDVKFDDYIQLYLQGKLSSK